MNDKGIYIYWKFVAPERVIQKTWNETITRLKNDGYGEITNVSESGTKTKRSIYLINYRIKRVRGNLYELRYTDRVSYRDIRLQCNLETLSDQDNIEHLNDRITRRVTGTSTIPIMNDMFKKFEGVYPRAAFGYCDRSLIRFCIPKQLYFCNNAFNMREMYHVYKDDVSSHYGASLCGSMPTYNESIIVDGMLEPSAEYPFAFYVKSGTMAIYNELDTRAWIETELANELFTADQLHAITRTEPADEKTILMHKSDYSYNKTVEKLYADKERAITYDGICFGEPTKIRAKDILNMYIGTCHLKPTVDESDTAVIPTRNRLDHIAAVCIARANQKMINQIMLIGLHRVYQVITDSIIYTAAESHGTPDKTLGAFVSEICDAEYIQRGQSQYMFFNAGKCILCKHLGFNENILTSCPDDIKSWGVKR